MAIFMKYGDLKGSSTVEGVADWIEIDSFQFGVGRGVSSGAGGATRETSQPSVSEITLSKTIDKSSGPLLEEALWGKGKDAQIKFARTKDGGGSEFYLEYKLANALVSGYSISSGGDRPAESISFNFTKFETKIALGDQANTADGAHIMGYDLTKTTKV